MSQSINANSIKQEDIVGKECRFVIHIPSKKNRNDDYHYIKEIIHLKDGTKVPNEVLIKDFERPFWITKKKYRNHKQKKECENISKLDRFISTESNLGVSIAKALGKTYSNCSLKRLMSDPYVYGADVMSISLIRERYKRKYPDLNSFYNISYFDVETDIFSNKKEIIIATVITNNEILTCIDKKFLSKMDMEHSYIISLINDKMKYYINEYLEKHNFKWEIQILDTEIDVVRNIFKKLHESKPDILAIWNQDFDINRVIDACGRANIQPKEIFTSPALSKALASFSYIQGKKKKVTASNKVMPISPASQWHQTRCISSFVVVDAMCAYKRLRMLSEPEQPSYALDAILDKELGIRKLKFEEAKGLVNLAWHQFMQTNYKLEYIVYNIFDCISMLELEQKTKDLSAKLPMFAKNTDFHRFNSSSKRATDSLFFWSLKKGNVLAAQGEEIKEPFNEELGYVPQVLSSNDWIVTLPSHNSEYLNGLKCLEDAPHVVTNIRVGVSDVDAEAAYPTVTSIGNVSKKTTIREIITIKDVPEYIFRKQNMDLMSGETNALTYCTTMFGFDNLDVLLSDFKKDMNIIDHPA